MNVFSKFFCRVYQTAFRIILPLMPYREPKILSSVADIKNELIKGGLNSVLIVTDKFLYQSGITKPLQQDLESANINVAVYSDTNPNPTVFNVEEGVKLYNQSGAKALIAFGGGSAMDCAKGIGARIAYPNKSMPQLKGLLKVLKKIPTLFAIPTTAGTGSECTLTAVITDSQKKHKYTMNDFTLIPKYAVLDAKNTVSLPQKLTSTTGLDALTHAVEAYIGKSTTKQTRAWAEKATKLIFENILTAYNQPQNLTARENMLNAAYYAGLAFSRSYVGYVHAVAHTLGGQYNLPHGLANSILLPVVLKEYGKSAHKKLYKLAVVCGFCKDDKNYQAGAEIFIEKIIEISAKMDIPTKTDCIIPSDIPEMAQHASKEANPLYPVPKLMNAKELEIFYKKISL